MLAPVCYAVLLRYRRAAVPSLFLIPHKSEITHAGFETKTDY